ncbi:MAG: ATP-dependent DNA helicase RecG [Phycisphaerales bacterium]|nr:ATP-dependent DNA helicase RecG [Phycisphaerales bacterium]
MTNITLTTPVRDLSGVSPALAGLLDALGLTNLGRLVAHIPLRHEVLEAETTIDKLVPGQIVSARGEVTATRPVGVGKRARFEAVVCDHTGRLDLVWFNAPYMTRRLHPGMRVRVQGALRTRGPGVQIANPSITILSDDEPPALERLVRPVYPASLDLSSAALGRTIRKALPLALPLIEDHLPAEFRAARALPELRQAYRMLHEPAHEAEAGEAIRRLAYDELLLLQLGVHVKRAHLRQAQRAPALRWNDQVDRHIRERFPFALTAAQDRAVREIAGDLSKPTPANRLIQGDVGSGKTAVALYAMLMAVASQKQASLMAPTELLAEQHYASISRTLAGTRVRVALLTGATPGAERAATLAALATGGIDILIGTHALLTEDVRCACLAVAVIDEQHRFGVAQRARLRAQASDDASTPHVLVMTATPIPRTLAITLFGDLDISTIDALPPGRSPVGTRAVSSDQRVEVYDEVASRISRGEQAFVVVPAIGPGEAGADGQPLRDVRSTLEELGTHWLAGHRLAALHGQLARDTRDAVMERFRLGQVHAVVATTVVEVGIDVPNATVMVVEQADRFGLAQLHQLRGRVGRGSKPGVCYLIADPRTPDAQERLRALESTTDGFVLAEKDLEIRGPGEMFGTRQSGLPPFRVADLARDRELLNMARRDAAAWIGRSPLLAASEEALLRRRLMKTYGDALGLVDVG